ncbi:hypothetical protein BH24ACT15_BH24ACT15_27040 [soil metagenome]
MADKAAAKPELERLRSESGRVVLGGPDRAFVDYLVHWTGRRADLPLAPSTLRTTAVDHRHVARTRARTLGLPRLPHRQHHHRCGPRALRRDASAGTRRADRAQGLRVPEPDPRDRGPGSLDPDEPDRAALAHGTSQGNPAPLPQDHVPPAGLGGFPPHPGAARHRLPRLQPAMAHGLLPGNAGRRGHRTQRSRLRFRRRLLFPRQLQAAAPHGTTRP